MTVARILDTPLNCVGELVSSQISQVNTSLHLHLHRKRRPTSAGLGLRARGISGFPQWGHLIARQRLLQNEGRRLFEDPVHHPQRPTWDPVHPPFSDTKTSRCSPGGWKHYNKRTTQTRTHKGMLMDTPNHSPIPSNSHVLQGAFTCVIMLDGLCTVWMVTVPYLLPPRSHPFDASKPLDEFPPRMTTDPQRVTLRFSPWRV